MDHGLASAGVTAFVWLLLTIMVAALASKYVRVPYTVALVIAGLAIAFTPVSTKIDLTPDLILFIFLPALLFESSYNLHFADVRENLRPITLLAVPGVLLTALGLAASVHYMGGVDWTTAFIFGAIMSATDPVSVLALFRQVGAPRRLSVILEGESLFNDGTSLVIFSIVLSAIANGGKSSLLTGVGEFLLVVLGGLALGVLVGLVASFLLSRVNDYLIETAMTLVVAYGTYLLAEAIGVSGVISVVVAAITLGRYGHSSMSPTTRVAVSSTWEFFGFLANSLIFVLIGLELNVEKFRQFLMPVALAILAVLAVRAIVVFSASFVLRFIHRPIPLKWQSVLIWGGLRGSIALAMALSLPVSLGAGQPFLDRDLLQVTTFGVILFSLLVQGLTMGPLLRRLGIQSTTGLHAEFETISVRRGLAAAALAETEKMDRAGTLPPDIAGEFRRAYTEQMSAFDGDLRALRLRDEDLVRARTRAASRHILQVQKNFVRERYLDGTISDEAARELLQELDVQIQTLSSEDPLGKMQEQATALRGLGTQQGTPTPTPGAEAAEASDAVREP